jgi:hypothetical protein
VSMRLKLWWAWVGETGLRSQLLQFDARRSGVSTVIWNEITVDPVTNCDSRDSEQAPD